MPGFQFFFLVPGKYDPSWVAGDGALRQQVQGPSLAAAADVSSTWPIAPRPTSFSKYQLGAVASRRTPDEVWVGVSFKISSCNLQTTTRKKCALEAASQKAHAQGRGFFWCQSRSSRQRNFIERAKERVVQRVRSVGNGLEDPVRQGVGRCRRTALEIGHRGRAHHHRCPTVAKADRAVAGPIAAAFLNLGVGSRRQAHPDVGRSHVFHCRGGDGVYARSAVGYPRRALQGAMHQRWAGCRVSWCKQRQVCTSHHFDGHSISSDDGKRDDSVTGRSARSDAKLWTSTLGKASNPG